ncbi:MAG: hypothetical protein ETSY2_04585 [Candidatus Entotheonella gemina]|uniref:Mitomycin antibiotics/polyketide fumonisin biosynthesis protein n=1 Tax=Candidatus Entotheonella gemina TaxID=1429439 RepID=W4MEB7_9BACT|nr:MAG: hypothetical protein ETSY2_04585 [Candidatus Entotheonella gemina]
MSMTENEKFLFDLWGYLVLEDVLTPEEVGLANEAIDRHAHLIQNRKLGLSHGAKAFEGVAGRGELQQNPLTFERPWCEPFRKMLTHPHIIGIFNDILGPGFRLDHGPGLIRMVHGTEGYRLHGGMTFDPSQYHHFAHGQMQCGLCTATWQLTDVCEGDGGFACIPGSHKSNYRPPRDVLAWENDLGCVKHIAAPAGSVIVFNEALVHGTLPWQPAGRERRSILFKCTPGFLSWGPPSECPIADPTPEELAIYEPPHRTGRTILSRNGV